MKIKLTLLVLSALLFNLSCKKPVVYDNVGPCLPITFLSKVTGTNRLGVDGSLKPVNMIFSYDSTHRIARIQDGLLLP